MKFGGATTIIDMKKAPNANLGDQNDYGAGMKIRGGGRSNAILNIIWREKLFIC